jgi:hypothetical protein
MRLSQQDALRALGDGLIRIRRKYGEKLDADIRRKGSAT